MPPPDLDLTEPAAARFAQLALNCVQREYPNKIAHTMASDRDAGTPRELHPAFYGCFDWHSSVHGHWMLARLVRLFPEAEFAGAARTALDRSLTAEKLAAEAGYFEAPGRNAYERPYGLAWVLQLAAELREWDDPDSKRWREAIVPLEQIAARRFVEWIPKLDYPARTGEHSQTAFAFGLAFDWARANGHEELENVLRDAAVDLYASDRDCSLHYEPSGQDFLSPCLAEADLMRRVMPRGRFADWLSKFLPGLSAGVESGWLPVAKVSDPSDPKIAHLDGLNLSRAWMLEGIQSALSENDPRHELLGATALRHSRAGLTSVTGEHYEGGHWLASFAVYLTTRRGIAE